MTASLRSCRTRSGETACRRVSSSVTVTCSLTDGGTNSSNRKAYDAFAAVVGADFHLPKDYVHARNANGRVTMGLHGYRIGEGEYGRTVSPFVDLWARRSLLGWTPRQQEGYHLRRLGGELRYGGAPLVADRPDGRIKPGELQNGGYGFYYKGGQAVQQSRTTTAGEDVLQELLFRTHHFRCLLLQGKVE